MDSILEYEPSEVNNIREQIKENRAVFKKHAADIFEDCFMIITSTGSKGDNFKLLRSLAAVSEDD